MNVDNMGNIDHLLDLDQDGQLFGLVKGLEELEKVVRGFDYDMDLKGLCGGVLEGIRCWVVSARRSSKLEGSENLNGEPGRVGNQSDR